MYSPESVETQVLLRARKTSEGPKSLVRSLSSELRVDCFEDTSSLTACMAERASITAFDSVLESALSAKMPFSTSKMRKSTIFW